MPERIRVDVVRAGTPRKEVEITSGSNVECAIREAGFNPAGHQMTVNGVGATSQTGLQHGDTVFLSPKIDGGAL